MSMSLSLGLDGQSKTDSWPMVWEDLHLARDLTSNQDRRLPSKKSAAKHALLLPLLQQLFTIEENFELMNEENESGDEEPEQAQEVGRFGIFTVCDVSCDALPFLTGLLRLIALRNLLAFHDIIIHLLIGWFGCKKCIWLFVEGCAEMASSDCNVFVLFG